MLRNLLILFLTMVVTWAVQGQDFQLRQISTFHTDIFDEGSVEICSYDAETQRAFFVNADENAVVVLDLSDPYNPVEIAKISQDPYGDGANGIDVKNGIVAVAIEAADVDGNGRVVLWDTDGNYLNDLEVGVLPDMVTFTNDGNRVLLACEGQPSDDYTIDPEGSISIVDLSNGAANAIVNTLGFGQFTLADAQNAGVRIFGPNATVAQDLEPEYIAVSDDDAIAYVVCQENNGIVVVDLTTETIVAMIGLGYKDHSVAGNGFDGSDKDDAINITTHPTLGMYQPDAVKYFSIDGQGFLFSANEGDARDYWYETDEATCEADQGPDYVYDDGECLAFTEEYRLDDLTLDPTAYPNAAELQMDENLGRLKVTNALGDTDGDGDIDQIYNYGARSFTIWDALTGAIVFDSGDDFEQILAQVSPEFFNATNDENDFEGRSDDKGPEPEAIEIAQIGNDIFCLIGLERMGGIMVYNVTDPANAQFVDYVNNRNFYEDVEGRIVGDLGVEHVEFISEADSPLDFPLVITGNEVSGTFTVFSVNEPKDLLFDEEIEITDFAATEITVPPSPLSTQVVFVGGHDIVQTTATYGNPAGQAIAKEWHDFIGWTPDDSGESMGWVTVNHEQIYRDDRIGDGGGMTAFRVARDGNGGIEVVDQVLSDGREGQFFNVDFVNTVGETGMNCAGITSPDGRVWTAEEWFRSDNSSIWNGNFRGADRPDSWNPHNPAPMAGGYGVRDTADFTIDAPEFPLLDGMTIPKYQNFNYMVEVDPTEAVAIRKQYNWGRAGWEGGDISEDLSTVYLGIDAVPAPWVKFEADTPGDFNSGTLYVFKHDNPKGERWVEVPENIPNLLGGLTEYAWSVGATMYMRNEWVAIDNKTGIVYWTETGRDSGSSGPGIVFNAFTQNTNAVIAPHHTALANERGHDGPTDLEYQDYYGRVLYYDPVSQEIGVAVEGGPYFENSPSEADYPDIHLSNPDGLKTIEIDGQTFLMISEDLNGTSNGRVPEGVSNRLCELYLMDTRKVPGTVDDLVRVTAVPAGAEITGAIQIDDNTILMNSQHPNANNPFPWNHSLTVAINGFADVTVDRLQNPKKEELTQKGMMVNETTRELFLSEKKDFALYDENGKRLKVYRNKKQVTLGNLDKGNYYMKDENNELFKINIQ